MMKVFYKNINRISDKKESIRQVPRTITEVFSISLKVRGTNVVKLRFLAHFLYIMHKNICNIYQLT